MGSLHGYLLTFAGVPDWPTVFSIEWEGQRVEALIHTDNDYDPVGIALWLRYDHVASKLDVQGYRGAVALAATRPMRVHLRPERAGDSAAVARGLSAEWQSGDVDFDRAVYVDSPTNDAPTLSAVLGPASRAAVTRLLRIGVENIDIDDERGRVVATLGDAAFRREGDDEEARELLNAFVALASALPRVEHSGGAHAAQPLSRWTKALGWIGLVGWCLNVGLVGVIALGYQQLFGAPPPALPWFALVGPLVLSLAGGVGCAALYSAQVASRSRGRSNAHSSASEAWVAAFGGCSVLLFVSLFVMSLSYFAR